MNFEYLVIPLVLCLVTIYVNYPLEAEIIRIQIVKNAKELIGKGFQRTKSYESRPLNLGGRNIEEHDYGRR